MPAANCPSFENCEAILCPLDVKPCTEWYPGEPICIRRDFRSISWIRTQRRINKVACSSDYFFNIPMLQIIERVHRGLVGANPERVTGAAKRWIMARQRAQKGLATAWAKDEIPLLPLKD